jgi:hypothetical protein
MENSIRGYNSNNIGKLNLQEDGSMMTLISPKTPISFDFNRHGLSLAPFIVINMD